MSWLNFNDSLNNIKGQISNFAHTVLTDETLDTQKVRDNTQPPELRPENKTNDNEFSSVDNWSWSTDESKTDQLKTDETITNLKKRILELENENRDLMTSLDQLDQNHQQNTGELVKMKSKLSEELEIVTEKYEILNMKYNKLALAENAYKKKITELKKKTEELSNRKEVDAQNNDDTESILKYKQLQDDKIELTQKLVSMEDMNKNLEMLLQETNAAIDSKLTDMASTIQQLEIENKALRIALQSKPEPQTVSDANHTILEEYKNKIEELNEDLRVLRTVNPVQAPQTDLHTQLKEYEHSIHRLENELEEAKKKEEEMGKRFEDWKNSNGNLEERLLKEREIIALRFEEQLKRLETELSAMKILDNENKNLHSEREEQAAGIIDIHQKYSQILSNNFREYFDDDMVSEKGANENVLLETFSDRLKNISSILADFETKCSSLDSKLFELNQAKTDLQNEKNGEIEKLLQNSEMLTQEVLKKSKEIKDLEEECSQLMKNNDLLISRLEETKETGLQTIFESNEDSAALWEKQLESANKKINELEYALADLNLQKADICSPVIENVSTVNERSEKVIELEESLYDTKEENESLKIAIEDLQYKLDDTEKERDNCRVVIDKMKSDFETTEYQFSEMAINLETLSEEIEKHKLRIDSLETENECLKSMKTETTQNKEKLRLIQEALQQSKEQNEILQNQLQQSESDFNDEIKKLTTELNKMQENFETIYKEKKDLKDEIENLSDSSKRMSDELGKMQSLNAILQKGYSDICKNFNIDCPQLKNSFEIAEIVERSRNFRNELDSLKIEYSRLVSEFNSLKEFENENISLKNMFSTISTSLNVEPNDFGPTKVTEKISELKEHIEFMKTENARLNGVIENQNKLLDSQSNENVHKELQDLMTSRNELIAIVQTKHQETLTYHAEIQRLTEVLEQEMNNNKQLLKNIDDLKNTMCSSEVVKAKDEEIEKLTDQKSFLEQKCDVLAQSMLEEQRKLENEKVMSSEKEITLTKNLERLQSHLMEVEEHYTQELLESEQKIALLQARLNDVEQREKDSSTIYTSVSIRANQQNEALQQQLQSMTNQRDEFKKKMMELEDENNVKYAALSNLQLVLEQFQRDKEADVIRETDRIRRQVKQEQKIQEDLRKEISRLEAQIKENKQGLQAALRLTDQLEMSKNQISTLKEEVTVVTDKLNKKVEELKTVTSQTDGKVDKSLIKNLVIGFVSSNKNLNKDQLQILKIIATVLDFNEQEHTKVNLNQAQQNNWLKSLLAPVGGEDVSPHESLSRAFVNFLESESKPRIIPSLLPVNSQSDNSVTPSNSSRTTPSPIVLNEIVLPTFSDFPQHRNSSSILKGVLKDNP